MDIGRLDIGRLDKIDIGRWILFSNMVESDFGRLDIFALLRDMVELDFGRLNNMYHFVTWYNWVLVDWPVLYYFVTW